VGNRNGNTLCKTPNTSPLKQRTREEILRDLRVSHHLQRYNYYQTKHIRQVGTILVTALGIFFRVVTKKLKFYKI